MSVIRTGIVETPISTDELAPEVVTAASGASVTFSGIIRDHDSGRGVERLVYESHPLADQQLAEVAAAVARA
ncbi:molybdenum cofactor biosynthesis protein MoaE, partial [Burkholderia multivorans]